MMLSDCLIIEKQLTYCCRKTRQLPEFFGLRNGLTIKQYFDCLPGSAKGALGQSIRKQTVGLPEGLTIAQLFERLFFKNRECSVTRKNEENGIRLSESLIIGQLFNLLSPKMQERSMTQICGENGFRLSDCSIIAQLFDVSAEATQSRITESRGENADYRSFSRLGHRSDSNRRRFWAAFMQCARHVIKFGSTECSDNAI